MPRFVVGKVQDALNEVGKSVKGSKILILGVAYKPDIDDMRESPSLDVIHLLENKNAIVDYHDPYVPHIHHEEWDMDSVTDLNEALKESDCVVIVTNHKSYNYAEILENSKLIVDTRNALGKIGKNNPKVIKL